MASARPGFTTCRVEAIDKQHLPHSNTVPDIAEIYIPVYEVHAIFVQSQCMIGQRGTKDILHYG